jgi:signal transduction histidine kinase
MLSSVADSPSENIAPPPGISAEVLAAAVCFAVGAGASGLTAAAQPHPPVFWAVAGWPIFALAGGVVLDQRPGSSWGRALPLFGLVPALFVVWAMSASGGLDELDVAAAAYDLAPVPAATLAVALPWALQRPRASGPSAALAVVTAVGALTAVGAGMGALPHAALVPGWALAVVGCGGFWTLVVRGARTDDRTGRRRIAWLLITLGLAGATCFFVWRLPVDDLGYYLTGVAVTATAITVARIGLATDFRPLDEHVLDYGLVVAVTGTAALLSLLVWVGARLTSLPSARASFAFTAVVTVAMAAPAALWVRRTVLTRRYGSGLISPADVAVITADLHAQTEPRDLLDKAARMVAAASGSRQATIVLGEDAPAVPDRWVLHPLEVGGDRVGALIVESSHAEGPELRQQRIIDQLLPTVALVARAVGLAVEADHARQDVARERDAERKRVMGDLHDGLGPILAGMSMRVQATLRTAPSSEYAGLLADLADGLAASRTDLRRIVAGITPSTLEDGDLGSALERLVTSFQGTSDGPELSLDVVLESELSSPVKIAVYRSVAEGVTNALRHAAASAIGVRVEARNGVVHVDVADDGRGGQIVPGVGLSSLGRRAESLGGRLTMATDGPAGTLMHLELPVAAEVSP